MKEKLRSMKRESGKWHDIFPIAVIAVIIFINLKKGEKKDLWS